MYRKQEILLGLLRQWMSRPHLSNLLRRRAGVLKPLAELIQGRILSSGLLHLDEATIKMPVRGKAKAVTAYLWGHHGAWSSRMSTSISVPEGGGTVPWKSSGITGASL